MVKITGTVHKYCIARIYCYAQSFSRHFGNRGRPKRCVGKPTHIAHIYKSHRLTLRPKFASEFGGISVTLYKDKFTEENLLSLGLNERQVKAVLFVKQNGKISNKDYQKKFGVARRTATRDLNKLVEKNILKPSDVKGAGSFYKL